MGRGLVQLSPVGRNQTMWLSGVLTLLFFAPVRGAIYTSIGAMPNSQALSYDYIVVGGGTAGLVMANRLSAANAAWKVLVVEAGGSDLNELDLQIPLLAPLAAFNPKFNWNYTTIPQPGYNNHSIPYPRGYVLGGCSSLNFMAFNRGSVDDWNYYANVTGDIGWSYNNMGQYFNSVESFIAPDPGAQDGYGFRQGAHYYGGKVGVSLPGYFWPSDVIAINASQNSSEFFYQQDYSGGNATGVGWLQATIVNGARASASTSYLYPVIGRSNLDVVLNTRAEKIARTGESGNLPVFRTVNLASNGMGYTATANREVILSAGAFNTPQLLMLSGIGAPDELTAAGILSIVPLPSVGKNMSDHLRLGNVYTTNSQNTFANWINPAVINSSIASWQATHTGPLAYTLANTVGFMRLPSNDPDIMKYGDPSNGPTSGHYEFLISDGVLSPSPATFLGATAPMGSFLTFTTGLLSPTSRGTVGLDNKNPSGPPILNPNFLSTDLDLYIMKYAVNAIKRFAQSTTAWKSFIIGPYGPFVNTTTDAELEFYIRNNSDTLWHACGTAAMSPVGASWGVVDPNLVVKHTIGLRVVDASVLPRVPAGHPQAVVYALAERAASLIIADAIAASSSISGVTSSTSTKTSTSTSSGSHSPTTTSFQPTTTSSSGFPTTTFQPTSTTTSYFSSRA